MLCSDLIKERALLFWGQQHDIKFQQLPHLLEHCPQIVFPAFVLVASLSKLIECGEKEREKVTQLL